MFEKRLEKNKEVYAFFIDMVNAFDFSSGINKYANLRK